MLGRHLPLLMGEVLPALSWAVALLCSRDRGALTGGACESRCLEAGVQLLLRRSRSESWCSLFWLGGPHPPCRHPCPCSSEPRRPGARVRNSLRPTAVAAPALCPKPVCLFCGSERDPPPYEIRIFRSRCRRPSSRWLLTRSPWMACWTTRPFLPRVPAFSENDRMTEAPDVRIENS